MSDPRPNEIEGIEPGADVIGDDGAKIGHVKATEGDELVVEKGLLRKHDVHIPAEYVEGVEEEGVRLAITDVEVNALAKAEERRAAGAARSVPGGASETSTGDQPVTTTMTGVGYGAGAGASSGGPLGELHGDQVDDRLGGSGRAGLGSEGALGERAEGTPETGTDAGAAAQTGLDDANRGARH